MSGNFKNRGMLLETIINQTNEFYFKNNICLIHKKNLDVSFKSVSLKNKKLNLQEATIKCKSSVDYYGVFQGKFIAFEAKSTEDNVLPLSNIKKHQIEYLNLIIKNKGIAFWIFYFKVYNTFLLVMHADFLKFLNKKKVMHFYDAQKMGVKLKLSFPGILDIVENITF
ncbi:Holliday junction resolvase RecU [Metamycoplasma canadense]|uniref:Holliday junction resolvase RecU n=1 Tax=Metamycoplasma canadense TaxID=29554 RepID=A0A077L6J4_9BACT|nr:Holliday junction resolvase RecU [Metamycoplasma canadense]BAP39592.1 recombination protein U [Metamycoplasma canadense]